MAFIRAYFPPEKTKKILSHKKVFIGNILAALLGIVTPFCSCSAVPLFIGFVESGVPLGVTFSFLISSPMVSEIALVMLWGLFGWKIAVIYALTGLVLAMASGIVIGKMKMERHVQDYVWEMKVGNTEVMETSFGEKIAYARSYTADLLKRLWPYVVVGIGVGAFVHGYVPTDFVIRYAGRDNPFAVFAAKNKRRGTDLRRSLYRRHLMTIWRKNERIIQQQSAFLVVPPQSQVGCPP